MTSARAKLLARCEEIDFEAVSPREYAAFIDGLPFDEFSALVTIHDQFVSERPAVAGYRPQSDEAVDTVNALKQIEEHVLRLLDEIGADRDLDADPRWLAIARTEIQQGFMAAARAVFKPERIEIDPASDPEIAWVLEREDSDPEAPLFFAPINSHDATFWSPDLAKALRFAREIDASQLAGMLGVQVRVCERQWSD